MRQMKYSGVEWIGDIPAGWKIHRIKNHFYIISGSGFKPDLQGKTAGDYPVCKASDISIAGQKLYSSANFISEQTAQQEHFSIIPEHSILFPKIGEAMKKNNRTISQVECCLDNNCQALVPNGINSIYAYYLLSCIDMGIFDNGGAIPSINNQKLLSLFIPYPDITEQIEIASYLDDKCSRIDAMITTHRKIIQKLKEYKSSLITETVTRGLNPDAEMKCSGVEWSGDIPAGWRIAKAKRFIRITNGTNPVTEGNIPVYGSGKKPFTTCGEYKEGPAVLLGRKGSIENPTYIEGLYWNVDTVFNVTPARDDLHIKYYYYLSTCFDYKSYMTQTAIPSMTQTNYGNMLIPLPPLPEQIKISAYLDDKCSKIDSNISTRELIIEKLTEYKKSLIYEVVTGKKEI